MGALRAATRKAGVGQALGLLAGLAWMGCRVGGGEQRLWSTGTVEATEVTLGFPLSGTVAWVGVREGDTVEAGQEVARLDRKELEARYRGAEAELAVARALLREVERGFRPEEVAEVRAVWEAARSRAEETRRELERAERLFQGGAVSRRALEQAQTAAQVAEAGERQARERLALVTAGARQERVEAQRAAVAHAEAVLGQVRATLAQTVLSAPSGGVVTLRHREPGEVVGAGMPVLTLMDPQDRWVRIYLREDRIAEVGLGQGAFITCDTYPDRRYRGEVVWISPRAEFTPRTVQTPEERVKLVYAVKVRITHDPAFDLKPGLPVDVVLEPRSHP